MIHDISEYFDSQTIDLIAEEIASQKTRKELSKEYVDDDNSVVTEFCLHEVVHTVSMVQNIFETYVHDSKAVIFNDKLYHKALVINMLLCDLYQTAARLSIDDE